MKKIIFLLALVSIMGMLVSFTPAVKYAQSFETPAEPAAERLPQEYLDRLPADYQVPDTLPATIHDPILLAGWVYLYNQEAPLRTWDGSDLTGRKLAQYILERKITVSWNLSHKYDGDSYSERADCGQPTCPPGLVNTNPIVITTRYQDAAHLNLARLAGTLAHETIHHMAPFGLVADTQYEEFWAFATGSQISKNTQADSTGYDASQPACLKLWFQNFQPDFYPGLPLYPQVVKPAAPAAPVCTVKHLMPGEVDGFPDGGE